MIFPSPATLQIAFIVDNYAPHNILTFIANAGNRMPHVARWKICMYGGWSGGWARLSSPEKHSYRLFVYVAITTHIKVYSGGTL